MFAGLVFAGGCVIGALTGSPASDMDIWLKCSIAEAEGKLKQIYEAVQRTNSRNKRKLMVTRSKHAVTFYRVAELTRLECPPVQVPWGHLPKSL